MILTVYDLFFLFSGDSVLISLVPVLKGGWWCLVQSKSDEYLTAKEAAQELRVHVETIRKLANQGELHAFRVGRLWRIPRDAILCFARSAVPVAVSTVYSCRR